MKLSKPLIILIGFNIAFLMSSCVSSKKYKTLMSENQSNAEARAQCTTNLDQLQKDYVELRRQKDSLVNLGSNMLSMTQKELDQKEQELRDREQRIKQLNAIIERQQQIVANLKTKVSDALVGYAADDLTVELRDGKVYVSLSEKLLFPSGSDKVNKTGEEALKKLANALANSDPSITIYIEGHTDDVPISTAKFADNWDLSVHRATSIIRILTSNGVSPTQVIASGRGEYMPVASNAEPEGRQRNRRTEIILSPKLDELMGLLQTK